MPHWTRHLPPKPGVDLVGSSVIGKYRPDSAIGLELMRADLAHREASAARARYQLALYERQLFTRARKNYTNAEIAAAKASTCTRNEPTTVSSHAGIDPLACSSSAHPG